VRLKASRRHRKENAHDSSRWKNRAGAASRGMGRASALALAGAGAQVFAGTLDLPQRNSVTHKGT